ncbi:MAG: UvrB/UvrC motif-containing protein [Phycisphaerae bacterium]|nr:UvrB/UvrC motif-containing protein [Phycisphaerae bacterium]
MGLCERCKKAQATFHLTNIEPDGQKVERHLCENCATEEGLLHVPKPTVNVKDVLDSFVAHMKEQSEVADDLVCGNCGISYLEFRNQGLLGCPQDYDAFREPLMQLIERAQDGATSHIGKTPKSIGTQRTTQQDVRRLKRQLEDAVAAEDYERAADLRDRLRDLEDA